MGKILIKAEEMVISAGGNIARLSAIYGPNRGVIFRGLMAGIKELPGPADRWINQVHRDDIVRALLLIAQKNPCGVFNVCDDEPVRLEDMCNWVCETFQKTMPKFNGEHSERRRSITNKRILNHKLKKLGWELQYPSFREGYAQVLASQSV
jgi:nucleoside-diphosphate-sugar epimerase